MFDPDHGSRFDINRMADSTSKSNSDLQRHYLDMLMQINNNMAHLRFMRYKVGYNELMYRLKLANALFSYTLYLYRYGIAKYILPLRMPPYNLKESAHFVQTRLFTYWKTMGRLLPAHIRRASLDPALHAFASDCFVDLSECKTRIGRSYICIRYCIIAACKVADCYRIAVQRRLLNEIMGVSRLFLRK
jgi:hypothetical protein